MIWRSLGLAQQLLLFGAARLDPCVFFLVLFLSSAHTLRSIHMQS